MVTALTTNDKNIIQFFIILNYKRFSTHVKQKQKEPSIITKPKKRSWPWANIIAGLALLVSVSSAYFANKANNLSEKIYKQNTQLLYTPTLYVDHIDMDNNLHDIFASKIAKAKPPGFDEIMIQYKNASGIPFKVINPKFIVNIGEDTLTHELKIIGQPIDSLLLPPSHNLDYFLFNIDPPISIGKDLIDPHLNIYLECYLVTTDGRTFKYQNGVGIIYRTKPWPPRSFHNRYLSMPTEIPNL